MMQTTRRVFLKYGLGACSAGAFIRPLMAQNPVAPYYKAVFDERFEDARAFAAEASARGIATAAIRGDVTDLFFHDLDLRWKRGPVSLIGLTTPASLFCLDLLARDRGMRLRFFNPKSDSSGLVSWIIAPSARASEKENANA